VTWSSPARASVCHARQRLVVAIEDLPGGLHAIARREGEVRGDLLFGTGFVAALASGNHESQAPSDAARRLVRARLASWLEIDEERIGVTREGRLPALRLDGKRVDATLSFSHHGRFAAFACRIGGGDPSAR
jgi:hypothetical protein